MGPSVAVVRAGRAFRGLAQVSVRDRERLARTLEAVRRESDCVLVDTRRAMTSRSRRGAASWSW